jgi:hypothetical protein
VDLVSGALRGCLRSLEKLTPEQQELAKSTASAHNTQVASQPQIPSEYYKPVDTGRVTMTMRIRLLMSVPGVGDVEDTNSGWSMLDNMLPTPDRATMNAANPAASKKTISLPLRSAVGGVLKAAPKDAAQAKMVVQAARERGFRQVGSQSRPPGLRPTAQRPSQRSARCRTMTPPRGRGRRF